MACLLMGCFLASCERFGNFRVVDFPDDRALHTLEEWTQHNLPSGECLHEVPSLVLDIVPESKIETDDYCGSENLGTDVLGCFFYDGSQPTIVLRNEMPMDPERAVEHELRHWLAMCSGYEPDGDPTHTNKPIWYPTALQEDWDYNAR